MKIHTKIVDNPDVYVMNCDSCNVELTTEYLRVYVDEIPIEIYRAMLASYELGPDKIISYIHCNKSTKKDKITGEAFSPNYILWLCHDCYVKHFTE